MKQIITFVGITLLGALTVIAMQLFRNPPETRRLDDPTQIEFTLPSGIYDRSISLDVRTGCADARIALTTDGSEPNLDGEQMFALPLWLKIEQPTFTVVKAKAVCPDALPTATIQGTYAVGIPHTLPIVSLLIDPDDLYDPKDGLFVNYMERGRDWERAANMTLLEDDTVLTFDAGVRMHGSASNSVEKKSMRLYFRDEYGLDQLDYPLLGENVAPQSHERLVLSSGGQDNTLWGTNWTLLRTQVVNQLAEEIGLPTAHARPVQLFLNTQPRGIYLVRNFLSDHFYRDKYGYDGVDEIRSFDDDDKDWKDILAFFETQNIHDDESLAWVAEQINLEELIDYYILQMYIVNTDWIVTNFRMFRPLDTIDGSKFDPRWRPIAWDVDYAFGLSIKDAATTDMFSYMLRQAEHGQLAAAFFKLLENDKFRLQFMTRLEELLNTTLSADNVSQHIETVATDLRPEIHVEILRWGNSGDWEKSVEQLHLFAQSRPDHMRLHVDNWQRR